MPLYSIPKLASFAEEIELPLWLDDVLRYVNEDQFYGEFPNVQFRPWRNTRLSDLLAFNGFPRPDFGMFVSGSNPMRPEGNRRRFDSKPGGRAWRRVLAVVNRTYGEADEYNDLIEAFTLNVGNPFAIASAITVNQIVDSAFGIRSRLLRRHVYSSGYWPFPYGYDTLGSVLGR